MNRSFGGPTSNGEEGGITGDEVAPGVYDLGMAAAADITTKQPSVANGESPFNAFMAATVSPAAGVENQTELVPKATEDCVPARNEVLANLDSSGDREARKGSSASQFTVTTDDNPSHPEPLPGQKGTKKSFQPIVDETLVGKAVSDPDSVNTSLQLGAHEISSSSSANTEVGTEVPSKDCSGDTVNPGIGTSVAVGEESPLAAASLDGTALKGSLSVKSFPRREHNTFEPTKLSGIVEEVSDVQEDTLGEKTEGESDIVSADPVHEPLHSTLSDNDRKVDIRSPQHASRATARKALKRKDRHPEDEQVCDVSLTRGLFGPTRLPTGDRSGDSKFLDATLAGPVKSSVLDATSAGTGFALDQNELASSKDVSSSHCAQSMSFEPLLNGVLGKPPIGNASSQKSQCRDGSLKEGKKRGVLAAGLEGRNPHERIHGDESAKKLRQAEGGQSDTLPLEPFASVGDACLSSMRRDVMEGVAQGSGKEKSVQFRLSSGSRKRKEPQNLFSEGSLLEESRDESCGLPTAETLKMMLYLEGSKVHRGQGAERRFGVYWDCLSRFLSDRTVPRVSRHNAAQSMEARVRSFLKTSAMKKLHNALVLALLRKCSKNAVAPGAVTRHIPQRWKRRVKETGAYQTKPQSAQVDSQRPSYLNTGTLMAAFSGWKKELDLDAVRGFEPPTDIAHIPELEGTKTRNATQGEQSESPRSSEAIDQSVALPGALEIDPFVRQRAKSDGMTVSEPAIWVFIIGMREYAKLVLEQAVSNAEGERNGRLRETDFPGFVAERSMPLDLEANLKKDPRIIRPFHLSYVAASNQLLGGSSTSRIRLCSESAITSCFAGAPDATVHDLRSHVLEEMQESTAKRRKVVLANKGGSLSLEGTEGSKPTAEATKTKEDVFVDNAKDVAGSTKSPRQDSSIAPSTKRIAPAGRLGSKNLSFMLSRSDPRSCDEEPKAPSPAMPENGQDHNPENGKNDSKQASERDPGEQVQGRRGMKSLLALKKSTSTREEPASGSEEQSGHVGDLDKKEPAIKLVDGCKATTSSLDKQATQDFAVNKEKPVADSRETKPDLPSGAPTGQLGASKELRGRSGVGGKVLSVLVEKAGRTG